MQPLTHVLGRFCLSSERRSFFPTLRTLNTVAHSPSKGRHLSLLAAGLLHCIYFLLTACSPRYYGVLIAFFLGGMGKSILIGQCTLRVS
jgi:hypothetical protein